MWVLTQRGFVSVTAYDERIGGERPDARRLVVVRARVREDLERLLPLVEIAATPDRDYPFRAIVDKADFASVLGREVANIDYRNFKDRVREVDGPWRENLYHQVWAILGKLGRKVAAGPRGPARTYSVPGYIRRVPGEGEGTGG